MYNEVYTKSKIRVSYRDVMKWANSLPKNTLIKKKTEAENLFRKIGITFSVYNNYDASERLLPFDLFPRVITHNEWSKISKGVIQRSLAINAFLHDIYHSGEIMKTKIIPRHLVYGNPAYEIKMVGFKVPNNIYSPIREFPLMDINLIGFDQWRDLISNEAISDIHSKIKLKPYQTIWVSN